MVRIRVSLFAARRHAPGRFQCGGGSRAHCTDEASPSCKGQASSWSRISCARGSCACSERAADRAVRYSAYPSCRSDAGLVRRTEAGRRATLRITPTGRRRRSSWLGTPVTHLRDLRTEFLLKLTLCERSGVDPTELIVRQREALADPITALTSSRPVDAVELWRRESARAARSFLDQLAG